MTSALPRWARRAALLTLSLAAAMAAQAEALPPVRIVVGFAAGGGIDTTARILAEGMGRRWARPSWWRTGRAPAA